MFFSFSYTSLLFDRTATKAYGIKMLRKPDSNMKKQDVKIVVELLNFSTKRRHK